MNPEAKEEGGAVGPALFPLRWMLAVAALLSLGALAFGPFEVAGVAVGAAGSALSTWYLYRGVSGPYGNPRKYLAQRWLVKGAALGVGAAFDAVSIWGVVAGLLTGPVAVLCSAFGKSRAQRTGESNGPDT